MAAAFVLSARAVGLAQFFFENSVFRVLVGSLFGEATATQAVVLENIQRANV